MNREQRLKNRKGLIAIGLTIAGVGLLCMIVSCFMYRFYFITHCMHVALTILSVILIVEGSVMPTLMVILRNVLLKKFKRYL